MKGLSLAILKPLIEKYSTIDAIGPDGNTALWQAVAMDNLPVVKLLLAKGANVNTGNQSTPLSLATIRNNVAVLALFLDSGADPGNVDRWGRSVLIDAARYGCVEAAQLLLAQGADVNVADVEGKTALRHAKDMCHKPMVRLLEAHGAKE
jgi:ankyrin repeat protein